METLTLRQRRVLVIGSGAIAGFYGALLNKVGWQVDMVARSDHGVIKDQGLRVDSTLGDLSFKPANVYADVASAGIADQVLVAIKLVDGTDLAGLLRPLVGPQTHIILIANGIDIEAPILEAFPDNPLTSCVAFVGASRVAPGHIRHVAFGRLLMGAYPPGAENHCEALIEAFNAAGIKARLRDNIATERWKKSLWNASLNPLSVLTNGATTETLLATPPGERLVRALMTEVMAVATAAGHRLDAGLIDANIENTRKMPAILTSMAQDYLAGRGMELDAIVGRVIAVADHHGLDIPHLRSVYTSLVMRQKSGAP